MSDQQEPTGPGDQPHDAARRDGSGPDGPIAEVPSVDDPETEGAADDAPGAGIGAGDAPGADESGVGNPGASATAPRLVRHVQDKLVAGVAGGLAAYLGVDPVLVRVAFVLLTFAGGIGIVLYLALWIIAPAGVPSGPTPGAGRRDLSFWLAIGLFVLAGLMVVDGVRDGGFVVALLLVGGGVALWRRDDAQVPTRGSWPSGAAYAGGGYPEAGYVPGTYAGADRAMAATAPGATMTRPGPAGGAPPGPHAADTPAWEPPPPRRRQRSALGGVTLAAALLATAVLVSLNIAGTTDIGAGAVASVALVVLGAGLLVGTVVGRARWLVLPALVVLPVAAAGTLVDAVGIDVDGSGGIGERQVVVDDVADLEDEYRLFLGELALDLSPLDLEGEEVPVRVSAVAAQLDIVVPEDVTVELRTRVGGGGEVVIDGESMAAGNDLDERFVLDGDPDAGTLVLDVELVFGEINVGRGTTPRLGTGTTATARTTAASSTATLIGAPS